MLLYNPHGELDLRPGEEGITYPGKAPVKRLLVQPTDAVQWVLYYPGIISYRDLPLSGPGSGSLTSALEAYDQGRLQEARQEAERVLTAEPGTWVGLNPVGLDQSPAPPSPGGPGLFQAGARPGLAGRGWSGPGPVSPGRCRAALMNWCARPGRSFPHRLILTVMSGYFSLMVGQVAEAQRDLESVASQSSPAAVLAGSLLAQMYITQNRKDAALTASLPGSGPSS